MHIPLREDLWEGHTYIEVLMTNSSAYSGSTIFFFKIISVFIVIVIIEIIYVFVNSQIIQMYRK